MNASEQTEFDRLNRQFYRADPGAVFVMKLNMLIFAASRSIEDLSNLLDGAEFEGLRIAFAPDAILDDDDAAALQSYVISEAHSIRYHAAECLMRLYLAHAVKGHCPWIDLAQLPSGSAFNSRVADIASRATDVAADVAHVFTGNAPNVDADSLSAAERFVRLTAEHLGESRNLHNAVKHGLGVVPGRTGFSFHRDSDSARVFGVDGPSIVYLERTRETPGQIRWHESTQWIGLGATLWLTRLTITQIDALWTIARMHYIGEQPEGIELITSEAIDRGVVGSFAESHAGAKFRRHIGIEREGNGRDRGHTRRRRRGSGEA